MTPQLPTKGPERFDERVESELIPHAHERLWNSPYTELRKITCAFEGGVLTLYGVVPRYFLKQYAYRVVADLKGVRHVENDIIVGERTEANRAAAVGAA